METHKDIKKLYTRFLENSASPEEIEWLLQCFEKSSADEVRTLIRAELEADRESESEPDMVHLYTHIRACINQSEPHMPLFRRYIKWLPYAAAILLMTFIGVYWYGRSSKIVKESIVSQTAHDVLPGGNKAYITFSDGRRMTLDSTRSGLVDSDGTYTYTDGTVLTSSMAEFATVSTPTGGTYQVTLPDGTKAWLNAESSIRYPMQFAKNERTVSIEGEVYLEVTEDKKHPFVVNSRSQRIMVLGTAFNVRNYKVATVTTLVHGKIALSDLKHTAAVTLIAGEQAHLSGSDIHVSKVDPSDYTAWMGGMILSKEATLYSICEELERWYGVRFIFPNGFKNEERALVSVDRRERLSTVLAALEKAYFVQFDIQGKEVRVN